MNTSQRELQGPDRQRGVTLIELMVGLTLGLIIATALLLLFANASSAGLNLQRSAVQIDNGRYAAELFRDDLRLAGFYGEIATLAAVASDPDPCSTAPTGFSATPLTLPAAVHGYAGTQNLSCLSNRKPGTAAIAVRRLDINTSLPLAISPTSQLYVQNSFCTSDPPATPLIAATAASAASFTLMNRACSVPNTVRAYVSRIYFVATCNQCAGGGDGMPTLKRLDLLDGQLVETPLVEGIEDLRFEYGFDIDGNGTTDTYLTQLGATGPTADWSNVMTVKVYFVSRSLDKASGSSGLATAQTFDFGNAGTLTTAADGYVRQAYGNTIRLINPSSVREAP